MWNWYRTQAQICWWPRKISESLCCVGPSSFIPTFWKSTSCLSLPSRYLAIQLATSYSPVYFSLHPYPIYMAISDLTRAFKFHLTGNVENSSQILLRQDDIIFSNGSTSDIITVRSRARQIHIITPILFSFSLYTKLHSICEERSCCRWRGPDGLNERFPWCMSQLN